ncbi:MAG: hypothetical protein ACREIC_12090 [Limisphaerales bacterium]
MDECVQRGNLGNEKGFRNQADGFFEWGEMENGNGNDRLAAFQKRIDATREKMTAEKQCLRQRKAKEQERLFRTVGEACCKAAQRPDFGPVLKAVLEAGTDRRAQDFLRQKGML